MICPVCKNSTFENEQLEYDLMVKTCTQCEGRWIPSFQYWRWHDKQDKKLLKQSEELESISPDSNPGKFCPECCTYLANRKVGHGINFTIDHCRNCKGFWLDCGEWEILKTRNLHDEIHLIFGEKWQSEIREVETKEHYQNMMKRALGDDFEKVNDFKLWLEHSGKKGVVLNYLSHKED